MKEPRNLKLITILVCLIVLISILHYSTDSHKNYFHEIYKLLYYIPIVLAAFYFGIRGGLIASISISIIYMLHVVFQWRGTSFEFVHRLLEIVVYNTVAYIVGRLAESERRQKREYKRVAQELEASYGKLKQQSETLSEVEAQLRHSERLSVMGELAASLAHEVRNPLGSIRGAAEILQADYSSENENYRFLKILIKEVDRLNQVIETFLGLARQKTPEVVRVNLQEAVESVVHIVSAKARKEKVILDCHLPERPVYFEADDNKFRQVLLNLLLNAMAASSDDGHVTINSVIREEDSKSRCLELSIEDNGEGIPEKDLANIFKPFYTTKENGTGLGLPITKRIADEYSWDLDLKSSVEGGTCVKLRIPLVEESDET